MILDMSMILDDVTLDSMILDSMILDCEHDFGRHHYHSGQHILGSMIPDPVTRVAHRSCCPSHVRAVLQKYYTEAQALRWSVEVAAALAHMHTLEVCRWGGGTSHACPAPPTDPSRFACT